MHLRRLKAVGAFSVKSYNQERRDTRQMILKAARELKMLVVPEGGSLLYHDETHDSGRSHRHRAQPAAGADLQGRRHAVCEERCRLHADAHRQLRRAVRRVLLVPARRRVEARAAAARSRRATSSMARARRRTMAGEDDFHHIAVSKAAKQIADAGGSVQLGAHGQLQGLGAHWELWMLAQGGMTPLEALRCATINGAALPRSRQGPRLDREGQARRPRRPRSQSARRHPQQRQRPFRDVERPPLRRVDARRNRHPRPQAAPVPLALTVSGHVTVLFAVPGTTNRQLRLPRNRNVDGPNRAEPRNEACARQLQLSFRSRRGERAVTRGASPVPGTKPGDGYGVDGGETVKSVTDVAEAWSLLASASVTVTARA